MRRHQMNKVQERMRRHQNEQSTEEHVNNDKRYNLRKRKQVNYDNIERCNARTLYQHGVTVAGTKKVLEDLLNITTWRQALMKKNQI